MLENNEMNKTDEEENIEVTKPSEPEKLPESPETPEAPEPPEPSEPEQPAEGEPEASEQVEQSAPAAKKLPKLSKKTTLIAGIAAIVVILIIIISTSKSPLSIVSNGFENTIESFEKSSIISLIADVADGGSVEVACDLEELTENTFGYGIDGNASIKLYSSDSKAALVADVKIEGVSLDATLIAGKDEVAISSEALFGKKSYGVNFKKLVNNFEDSIFGPDGEFSRNRP